MYRFVSYIIRSGDSLSLASCHLFTRSLYLNHYTPTSLVSISFGFPFDLVCEHFENAQSVYVHVCVEQEEHTTAMRSYSTYAMRTGDVTYFFLSSLCSFHSFTHIFICHGLSVIFCISCIGSFFKWNSICQASGIRNWQFFIYSRHSIRTAPHTHRHTFIDGKRWNIFT